VERAEAAQPTASPEPFKGNVTDLLIDRLFSDHERDALHWSAARMENESSFNDGTCTSGLPPSPPPIRLPADEWYEWLDQASARDGLHDIRPPLDWSKQFFLTAGADKWLRTTEAALPGASRFLARRPPAHPDRERSRPSIRPSTSARLRKKLCGGHLPTTERRRSRTAWHSFSFAVLLEPFSPADGTPTVQRRNPAVVSNSRPRGARPRLFDL